MSKDFDNFISYLSYNDQSNNQIFAKKSIPALTAFFKSYRLADMRAKEIFKEKKEKSL